MRSIKLGARIPLPEEEPLPEAVRRRVRDMGQRARVRGVPVDGGPYQAWTEYDVCWRRGWLGIKTRRPEPGEGAASAHEPEASEGWGV